MAPPFTHQARSWIRSQNVLISNTVPFRSLLGVLVKDLRRYAPALWRSNEQYLTVCNRNEVLQAAPDGSGYRCEWEWTSDLHAPRVIPRLGARLMRLALRHHPICLNSSPANRNSRPQVSFIIGHRGDPGLPHLLRTLQSIAGQNDVGVECIVVEQDMDPRVRDHLPAWVRHLHSPPPTSNMPFCRSWAFNVGIRHARGDVIVLHDNDLLVPADYASRCLNRMRAGFDVVNLKRFGFYLSEAHTREIFADRSTLTSHPPETIMQNALGGGSIAIAREAFLRIGCMDEGFIGWGGEDNEFWDRAQTLNVWPFGSLPYVHLWHPDQTGKYDTRNPTLSRLHMLSTIPVRHRIDRLLATPSGAATGPVGWDGALNAAASDGHIADAREIHK
jgi:hypothetical protein